jgi:hypothetical protein
MLAPIIGYVLGSLESGSSQRAVRMCVCVDVGNVQYHGRVRSLTQVPSLCEPDESRRLCASLVAYCGHSRAVRGSSAPACGQDVCARVWATYSTMVGCVR